MVLREDFAENGCFDIFGTRAILDDELHARCLGEAKSAKWSVALTFITGVATVVTIGAQT